MKEKTYKNLGEELLDLYSKSTINREDIERYLRNAVVPFLREVASS